MEEQSPSSMLRAPSCFRRASKGGAWEGGAGTPSNSKSTTPRSPGASPALLRVTQHELPRTSAGNSHPMDSCGPVDPDAAAPAGESRGGVAAAVFCAPPRFKVNTDVGNGAKRRRSDAFSTARSNGVKRLRTANASSMRRAKLTGYLGSLPMELLEIILRKCAALELASLEASCTYFLKSGLTEAIARAKLREIPRARGLKPERKNKETHVMLLHFVNCQSQAAAQGTAVAFGAYHSAGLLIPGESRTCPQTGKDIEHSLFTFGRGFHGQLGQGDFDSVGLPKSIELSSDPTETIMPAVVACGSSHTCSISRRGELFTWGLASSGELGHGGWTPIEMNFPSQVLALSRTRIVSVTAGTNHTLAISEFGHLWTCGRGRHGQLGHGTFNDEGPLQRVDALVGCRIVSAAAGTAHSMALASDGSLFTWGCGQYGQLGHKRMKIAAQNAMGVAVATSEPEKVLDLDPEVLKPPNRVTAIASGTNHSLALTVGGTLLVFGRNKSGCLGLGDTSMRWVPTKVNLSKHHTGPISCRVVQVTAGGTHTMALVSVNGSLKVATTGSNSYGQLGHGDTSSRHRFTTVRSLSGKHIVSVSSGHDHAGAVDRDGRLYMWGRGELGQLGLGDFRSHWTPQMLPGVCVVHPDRTLRRNRTSANM